MTRFFCLVLIILLPLVLSASNSVGDKVPGYVLLDNGKRLEGKIIIGTLVGNELNVEFFSKGSNIRKKYIPKDLQAYGYQIDDISEEGLMVHLWVHYKRQKVDKPPFPFGPTLVFMQMVEQGAVNLYTYFVEISHIEKQNYEYEYYIETETDPIPRKVQKDYFEQNIRSLIKDYTALSAKIGKENYTYRNLDQIVRDFNFWTVSKHDKNEYRMAMRIAKGKDFIEAEKF